MTRNAKFLLALIVAASFALALGALGWRWREAGDVLAIFAGEKPFRPVMLAGLPVMLAVLLAFSDRQAAEQRLNRYGQGFVSLTLVVNFLVLLGMQAWMATIYLGAATPDREFVTRLLVAFLGLGMAVRGNFFAKLSSADDVTGAWGRITRRTGVLLVAMGLVLAACAVSLPIKAVLGALVGAFVAILAFTRIQRRASRSAGV